MVVREYPTFELFRVEVTEINPIYLAMSAELQRSIDGEDVRDLIDFLGQPAFRLPKRLGQLGMLLRH